MYCNKGVEPFPHILQNVLDKRNAKQTFVLHTRPI